MFHIVKHLSRKQTVSFDSKHILQFLALKAVRVASQKTGHISKARDQISEKTSRSLLHRISKHIFFYLGCSDYLFLMAPKDKTKDGFRQKYLNVSVPHLENSKERRKALQKIYEKRRRLAVCKMFILCWDCTLTAFFPAHTVPGKEQKKAEKEKKGNPPEPMPVLPLEDGRAQPAPSHLDEEDLQKVRHQIFKMTGICDTKMVIDMDEISYHLIESIKRYNLVAYKELEAMTPECYAKGFLISTGIIFSPPAR